MSHPRQANCCCRIEDAADCFEARNGPSLDEEGGRPEECSCACHEDILQDQVDACEARADLASYPGRGWDDSP